MIPLKNSNIGKLEINNELLIRKGAQIKVINDDDSESLVSKTELAVLDVTPGTATASKAVVLNSSKGISEITSATITNLTVGAGGTINADSATATATGNNTTQSATVTKMAGTVTTGALTTAANGTTSVVLTLTGVAAGDLVFATIAGGTNTVAVYVQSAIATTDTITIKLRNGVNATTALNGTVAIHYLWVKA